MAQVDAEYVVLLNSDVRVTSHCLEPLLDYMDTHSGTVACQPKQMCIRDRKYNGKITSNLDAVNPDRFVDEMHFTNVIFNLLDIALKYKKQEGDLLLNIRTWLESDKLYISIQDNEIGIKKENLKKIFDKDVYKRQGLFLLGSQKIRV